MRWALLVITAAGLLFAAAASADAPTATDVQAKVIHRDTTILSTAPDGDRDVMAEAGEPITFSVVLRNIGDGPATGISATLSQASFSLQQGTSAYPDLPPGGTGTNATPFAGTLPADAVCGGAYRATLAVTTQQGSFSVPVAIPVSAMASQRSWFTSVSVPIPDNGTVESPLTLTSTDSILDLNVRVSSLFHTWIGDLVIGLVPPGSPGQITLVDRRGGGGTSFNATELDDEANVTLGSGSPPFQGSFQPDSTVMLQAVDGLAASGVWHLRIADVEAGDTGTLSSWSIRATIGRCDRSPNGEIHALPTVLVGRPFAVSGRGLHDVDGPIAGLAWDLDNDGEFDDGTELRATATFTRPGTRTVRLRILDSGGNATVASKNVSVLPLPCWVPRVVGKTLPAARRAINRAGCRVGRVRRVRSRRVGRVLSQSPRARSQQPRGKRVNLVVGRR